MAEHKPFSDFGIKEGVDLMTIVDGPPPTSIHDFDVDPMSDVAPAATIDLSFDI